MIPKHVAIIPDGNRRWAKKRKIPLQIAYKISRSYKRAKEIGEEAKKLGIKYFSIWAFSTENSKRDKKETKWAFESVEAFLNSLVKNIERDKYRFVHIGRKDRIPKKTLKKLNELETKTKKYKGFTLILGIDYGGRDEIIRSVNKAIKNKKAINEKSFKNLLDTKDIPDPDLIIRTGGEKRLSGFMPFQTAYSELYFTKTLFPAFGVQELREAIENFKERKRNFGE